MNIDLIYLFYECADSNIVSCADDTTPYVCGKYTEKIQYIYIYIYIYIKLIIPNKEKNNFKFNT